MISNRDAAIADMARRAAAHAALTDWPPRCVVDEPFSRDAHARVIAEHVREALDRLAETPPAPSLRQQADQHQKRADAARVLLDGPDGAWWRRDDGYHRQLAETIAAAERFEKRLPKLKARQDRLAQPAYRRTWRRLWEAQKIWMNVVFAPIDEPGSDLQRTNKGLIEFYLGLCVLDGSDYPPKKAWEHLGDLRKMWRNL